MDLDQFDKALQAPTMEAVIALTERFQDLESKPEAMVFSFLRNIDQTIAIGYSDDFSTTRSSFEQRDFVLIDARRGTKREERLLLLTLKEIGLNSTYNKNCFDLNQHLLQNLNHLGWPIGDLRPSRFHKQFGDRINRPLDQC